VTKEGLSSSVKDLIQKDKLILRELLEFKELKAGGVIILLITFVLVVADGLIWTMEPLYTTLGLDAELVGIMLSMFVIPYILFDAPAGYLADKIGKTKTMFLGLLIAGIFLVTFSYLRDPMLLIASAFLATTGLALVRPSVDGLLTDLAEKKHKGGIVGVWDVSEDAGYVIGPILGGVIAQYYGSISVAFMAIGGILLLLVPVVLVMSKRISASVS
jgi:DHA1 family quinolone resistance protein-like MFS transporter